MKNDTYLSTQEITEWGIEVVALFTIQETGYYLPVFNENTKDTDDPFYNPSEYDLKDFFKKKLTASKYDVRSFINRELEYIEKFPTEVIDRYVILRMWKSFLVSYNDLESIPQNDNLNNSVIINKDIGVKDFCDFLIGLNKDYQVFLGDNEFFLLSEMYEYIKQKSNNFDRVKFDYLILDIRNYSNYFPYYTTETNPEPFKINNDTGYPDDPFWTETIEITHYFDRLVQIICNLMFEESQSLKERIKLIIKYECDAKSHAEFPFVDKLFEFSDLAEKEYQRICEKERVQNEAIKSPTKGQPKTTQDDLNNPIGYLKPKRPKEFKELFIEPYSTNLDNLYCGLSLKGLIDINTHIWREPTDEIPKSEIAKFYSYLKKKTNVLVDIDDTNGLKCFCEHFGVYPYTDREPKPQHERIVALKTLTNAMNAKLSTRIIERFDFVLKYWKTDHVKSS